MNDRPQHEDQSEEVAPGEETASAGYVMHVDYYQRAFGLFHQQLAHMGYKPEAPHSVREQFWGLLLHRSYDPPEARELLLRYLGSLEREVELVIGKHSLAYWLHLYRRLSPWGVGNDPQPYTVGIVRAVLEAAIQKHALLDPCGGVGVTGEIPIQAVLGGLLMHPEFEIERKALEHSRQLVLTDFSPINLKEFYDVEKLGYEVWRAGAQLRIIGKGAPLLVVDDSSEYVADGRSPELARLVSNFDSRLAKRDNLAVSASGVIFAENALGQEALGIVFLPTYNLGHISSDHFEDFFQKVFGIRFSDPIEFNFIWFPFNLRQFRFAHLPFADGFRERHGIELDSVLTAVAVLCQRVFAEWIRTRGAAIVRYWQRAYEGPRTRESIFRELEVFLPAAERLLGLSEFDKKAANWLDGVRFLELLSERRSGMDLVYPGPHSVFLPFGVDRLFVDYTWIVRRLYNLFLGVNIKDQSFKGEALERVVRFRESVLPTKPCRAGDEQRQIDAAFRVGDRLIIAECKAVGRSIGFDRGQPEAIRFRIDALDRALDEVDEKAWWLAAHPVGSNYNISEYRLILPIVVSPFVEYIPSLSPRYWLTGDLPRVMTPEELKDFLSDGTPLNVSTNLVAISLGP